MIGHDPPGFYMRIQIPISLIVVVLILNACAKRPEDKLIGEWKSTDPDGAPWSIIFNRDRSFHMVVGSKVLDGVTTGEKTEWRVDASRDPISLDFVLTSQSGQQRLMPMIIRFITDQKIQIRMSPDMKTRPASFSAEETEQQEILAKQ